MQLSDLPLNASAMIKNIHTDKATEERLHSFGLYKNTEITPIVKSPTGSPRVYRCLNTLIAIRNDDAKFIEVEIYESK